MVRTGDRLGEEAGKASWGQTTGTPEWQAKDLLGWKVGCLG